MRRATRRCVILCRTKHRSTHTGSCFQKNTRNSHAERLEMARLHSTRNGVKFGHSRRRVSSGYTSDKDAEETTRVR